MSKHIFSGKDNQDKLFIWDGEYRPSDEDIAQANDGSDW